jgi:hypothetical protein
MAEQATVGMRELIVRFAEDPAWVPAMTAAVTDAVVAELPDVADPEFRDMLYASCESNIRLVVEMLSCGFDPAEAVPPPAAVEYAREFVRRGMSIDSLLRAYFIGHAAFLRRWMDQLGAEIEDPVARGRAIEEAAAWTFPAIEALTRGIVDRYTDERERWARSSAAVKAEVVRALLADERLDLDDAATRLRYQLDRQHIAYVVWAADDQSSGGDPGLLEQAATELGAPLGTGSPLLVAQGARVMAGWVGSREPLDEAAIGGLRLSPDDFPGLCAAFGATGAGVAGFRSSHREALHARRVAMLRAARPGSVTVYRDVALAALASADVDHAAAFVRSELGPLVADDDQTRRLAATLRIYLEESRSPRRTAQRLGVHENTIANRIRAVQALLDRPIEERLTELLVALRLMALTMNAN